MRNFTLSQSKLLRLISLVLLLFVTSQTRAQFPYSQSFKNSTAPGVSFGGSPSAFLTGGFGPKDGYTDLDGSGYLRLTNRDGSQKGIVYSDIYSFPSAYGMTISFEYYTHSGNGADGIAFILFDATATATAGAFGGSLGYAQRNQETGFSKGYLGIGIDEYGNFSANNEGKSGGAPGGVLPSNITLRGAGSDLKGYDHLISVQTTALASSFNVAGGNRNATNSSIAGFRKMEVVLKPRTGGGFFIDVYLTHGSARDLIINNYEYKTTAPPNLKFAISSSTGGSNNFHEIRNLNITVDPATLLTPIANADSFEGCIGLAATSGDITANDNGAVNTMGTINKSSVDLDPATSGIQTTKTVSGQGVFTYDSTTGKVTFTPIDNTIVGPVTINYTFDDSYGKTSNSSTITYKAYAPITNNSISPGTSSFCDNIARSTVITGAAATDGKGSNITYRWESSSNNITFGTISGATNQNYTTPSINTTMYYRRIASTSTCSNVSNVAAVIYGGASAPTATAATAITCNSFTANWNTVPNATSYGLEVSTNSDFSDHLPGYDGSSLTTSNSYNVSGLISGKTYYLKVWSHNACGAGLTSSNVITVIVGNGSVAGTVSGAQTICSGTSPQDLTLTGYTGTIQWQSSINNSAFNNINGATAAVLTSAQMGALTANTYYRAVVKSGSCTEANSTSVLITISPVPSLASVSQPAAACAGSPARMKLTGLLPGSTSTITYSIDGVAQTPITGIAADASGEGFFETAVLTAANNGKTLRVISVTTTSATPNCTSTVNRDVTLNVNAYSVGGTVASVPAICAGSSPANLVLSGNTGSVLRWQKSTDAGFSTFTDINVASTTLTSAAAGNLTANTYFRAVVQNGVCSAVFSDVVLVTVNALPIAYNVTGTGSYCSGGSGRAVGLSNSQTGVNYQLRLNGTDTGSPVAGNGNAITFGTKTAAGTYTVKAVNATTSCSSTMTGSAEITIDTFPGTANNTTSTAAICSTDTKTLSATPAGGTWSVVLGGGTISGTTYTPAAVTTNTNVTIKYTVAANGSCASTNSDVTFTVNPFAGTANNTTSIAAICSTDTKTLSATPAGGTWSVVLGGGTISGTTYTPDAVTADTNVTIKYTVAANGSCASTNSDVTFTVNPFAGTANNTTSTAAICSTDTKTLSATPAGGTWSIVLGGGTISGTTYTPDAVTADTNVTIKYTVAANGSCASTNSDVTFTVNPFAGTANNTTSTAAICSTDTKSLSATPAGGTWSIVLGGGSISGTTYTPDAVTADTNVTIKYTVAANGSCASTNSDVTFKVNPFAGTANNTTSTAAICSTDTKTLSATPAGGTWSIVLGGGSISGTTYTPDAVTADTNVTIKYTVAANGSCASTNSDVTFTVFALPVKPTLSAVTQQTCTNPKGSVTITDYDPAYTYTINPSLGVIQNNDTVTAPVGSYSITASVNGCTSDISNFTINSKICAEDDNTYLVQIPSYTTATTVGNVTANDKLNGVDVTALNTTVTAITTGPLSIDASGVLTLDPNTISGTYTITYQICEKGANPVNCDTAEATVVVKGTLVANDDSYSATPGTTVATTVGNVTANDKLNGVDVTALNTTVTAITTGPLSIDASGVLTLDPNTVSGTYTITYQICEKGANPVNCDTAEATVVVKGTLVANDDSYTATPGTTVATTVGNVTANDKLNGVDVTALNTTVTAITTGPLSIDASGVLTLDPNTVSGTYTITYQICEKGANPVNCDTAEATVVVKGTLVANDDSYTATPGTTVATTVGNVTANDKLNGVDVTALNTTVTAITTGPLSIDASGVLTLDPNTVSGTYTITYQICEKGANPVNCDTAEATVVVKGTLVANDDSYTATPGTTVATTVGNVTANDKLNGVDVTALNTTVTAITTGPLSIDASGVLTLDPNTASGTYTITYQICEKGANPVNCDRAEATVVVKGTLVANDDSYTATPGTTVATTVGNVTANDKLNGVDVTALNTTVTAITTGPLSIDASGVLTLDPNTVSGTYTITYQICEKGANPVNCDTAEATVVVGKSSIIASGETTLPINGSIGGTTTSLIKNVTLNGDPAVSKNSNGGVILTPVNVPTGLTLNPDGTVTVKPGTPIGNYEIEYSICEYLNPTTNCVTVKSYVPVTGGVLQANNDNAGTVDTSKGQNSTTSIFDNDILNGSKLNPADVVLTTIVSNPNLILLANGTIEIKPGTPTGNYELTYQICEALNPTINCSQAVAKISVVNNPPITPLIQLVINNDGVVNVDGINGALEFINVLDNDLVKGLPVNPAEIVLSNTPNPYFEFNSDGTVNVKPNTPGGSYSLTYQVCEKANQTNCGTATLSVFVEVPSIAIIKTAVFNDEDGSGFANAGETIIYKFKVTNTGNVPLTGVTVADPLPGVVVSGQAISLNVNESDEHNFTATYKITQSDINKGSVSNQASVQARSAKGVVVDDLSDDENETGDKPTVLGLNGCEIKVFNAFSPNGDNLNSRFYIRGLECYPDNTVEIYNRWGVLVYDINNYNNEDRAFKGFSEGRTTVKQSEGLPVGTYFYILKYKDSGSNPHELSGYLYINK